MPLVNGASCVEGRRVAAALLLLWLTPTYHHCKANVAQTMPGKGQKLLLHRIDHMLVVPFGTNGTHHDTWAPCVLAMSGNLTGCFQMCVLVLRMGQKLNEHERCVLCDSWVVLTTVIAR